MKNSLFLLIACLILSISYKSQSQNSFDFEKMKAKFEMRRPSLDTLAFGPEKYNMEYQIVKTLTTDNIEIVSWFIPNKELKGTIIMVHGFDMNKSGMLSRAKFFYDLGYSVLLPDLRARGESGGDKATTGKKNSSDIISVCDYYKANLNDYGQIVFYGFSHGGRAVVFGSSEISSNGSIILESMPYYLLNSFKRQYKMDIPMKVDESPIQNALVKLRHNKILLLVGEDDTAINPEEGNELIRYSENKDSHMIVFENTGHSIFNKKNIKLYNESIINFLK